MVLVLILKDIDIEKTAIARLASDLATLPAVMPVIDLMAPNSGGANGTNGTGGACECYIGKLTLRAFFLLGFNSGSIGDFLARVARDDVASGDVRWIREAHTGTTHVRSSGDDEGAGPYKEIAATGREVVVQLVVRPGELPEALE